MHSHITPTAPPPAPHPSEHSPLWRIAFATCALLLGIVPSAHAQKRLFDSLHEMLPPYPNLISVVHVMGDVDGDGDLDLVIGGRHDQKQNHLFLNDGNGTFSEATAALPADADHTYALALGDLDADGDIDLVLGSYHGDANRLYLNDGTGSFTDVTATNMPAGSWTTDIALCDVDGDGDSDMVLARDGGSRRNHLYLNDGFGFFTDATTTHMPVHSNETSSLALGDMDGDGDPDLVVGNSFAANRMYLNDGTGIFRPGHLLQEADTHDFDRTLDLALGDVDGDGDRDVIFGNGKYGPARLYLNDGVGILKEATATNMPLEWDVVRSLALEDVDGDGDLDLVLARKSQNGLFLNDGTGVFSDATVTHMPEEGGCWALAVGDVDGDGDPDLALGLADGGSWGWAYGGLLYLNDGDGAFERTPAFLPWDVDKNGSLVTGDVNGDGNPDLVAGNSPGCRLYLGDGYGGFVDVTEPNMPDNSIYVRALVLGDVDGDGAPDLLLSNVDPNNGRQNHLFLNDGTGVFADATVTHMPPDADITTALALGDVDGDWDMDLVLGNIESQNRLYLNDGFGFFSDATATNMPADLDNTDALALDDVDGDGYRDLVLGNGGQDRLYMNDGTGVFVDRTAGSMPVDSDGTRAVTLGDVDGDEDLDLAIGTGGGSGQTRLYVNDGTGVFSDVTATQVPADTEYTRALALGDLDGDGDLDMVLGNYMNYTQYNQSRLYLNDGSGVFSDETSTYLPGYVDETVALVLADMDTDGDPDIIFGNNGRRNRLFTNITRQLAWRGLPRVGKPLTMELYGPPSTSWVLSLSTIDPPGGGVGGMRATSAFQIIGTGVLDGDGRDSYTLLIADDSALVGTSWYWRARVGGAVTNLEKTTFTNL